MKLTTCEYAEKLFLGMVLEEDNLVIDIAEIALNMGISGIQHSMLTDMITFLNSGDEGKAILKQILELPNEARPGISISQIKFHAPVKCPGKLFCLAGNYAAHIEESHGKMAIQDKETPRFFIKPSANTVIGNGEAIILPRLSQSVDWEGELAVVIGTTASRVTPENAMQHVGGYTIMNDVSERNLKIWERSSDRPKDAWFDWLNGKWCDTFAPMGPWLVTPDEITDPHNLVIRTYVNGELKQNCSTGAMLIKIPELIAYISAIVTLLPGDIISTGTVAGVGAASGKFLNAGDRVRISISSIGELCSTVIAEK